MRVRPPRHITALRTVTAPAVRTQLRRPKVVRIDWAAPAPEGALSRLAGLVMLDL